MIRFKKVAKLIVINLLVFILILLVLEGLTRLFSNTIRTQGTDDVLLQKSIYHTSLGLKKSYTGYAFDREVNTDVYHFRKNGITFNDSLQTTLLLGDSVTMGVGVNDLETFSALIQEKTPNINIANPSVIGFDTYDYVNVYESLAQNDKLNIKKVIVFFCLNDIYVRENNDTAPMLSGKPFIGKIFDFLKTNSYFYIWLKGTFFDRSKVFFENDYSLYKDKNVEKVAENFKKIAKSCNANQIEFNVVLLPYEYQLRNHENDTIYHPQKVLSEKLIQLGINVFDCKNYVKNNINNNVQEAFLFADGIHFSEKGHQIIADYTLHKIIKP
jgi:lysophospholipase L1-like esterase